MSLRIAAITLLACAPLLPAQAAPQDAGIGAEIRREMIDARKEVRAELAQARRELATENLQLDGSFRFNGRDDDKDADNLPPAAITPDGDFLIAGKPQPIDIGQRRQLLAYRGLVLEVAGIGIDIGQKGADAALDAVDGSWIGMLFSAMTGSLERRIERTVREQIEPGVRSICRLLPRVRDSQQQLASRLPTFRPYANLDADDITDCENDVRREFASR